MLEELIEMFLERKSKKVCFINKNTGMRMFAGYLREGDILYVRKKYRKKTDTRLETTFNVIESDRDRETVLVTFMDKRARIAYREMYRFEADIMGEEVCSGLTSKIR